MASYKGIISVVICLLGIFSAGAYEKMSVSTQAFLDNRSAFPAEAKRHAALSQTRGQEMVDVFITLRNSHATSGIAALGGVIGARFSDIVTAQVPVAQLEAIAALDEVEQVSIAEMMTDDVDTTRSVTSVNYVAEGLKHGLPANYDGKGVVFGIIDSGIDFNHAAFQDSLGHTRIKRVYMPADNTGTKVVFDGTMLPGSEFDSTQIATLTTDLSTSAHGAHTAYIGAGSAYGPYSGMAPGADIVICALAGKSTDVNMANSLKYITRYAKSVGKPCVISVSIGTKKGPHDGTSKICKIYDEVGKDDAVVCLSAGNLGGLKRHIYHKFSGANTSTSPTIGSFIGGPQASGYTAQFSIDTWSRSRSIVGIKYLLIDPDDNSIFYETGIMKAYTYHYIGPGLESKRGYNAFLSQYFSGKIGVWVTTESNGHVETYSEVSLKPLRSDVKAYKVAVQYYGADGVEFDSWMNSDHSFAAHAPVGNYHFVEGNDSCSINDNVTGKYTISVGNYVGRNRYMALNGREIYNPIYPEGEIHPTSSYGMAPNGVAYPFVAAPGYLVISAYNGYNYLAAVSSNTAYARPNPTTGRTDYWGSMSGTSMSTPTVAGIVALWLQANPSLKVSDVKEIIQKSAYVDDAVHKAPLQFGAGKINALGGFPDFQYRLTDVRSDSRLEENHYFSICDSTLTCARVSADGRTIYAKDDTPYARQDTIAAGQTDYIKAIGLMPDSVAYDQSNWVLLRLLEPLDSTQKAAFVGKRLKNVGGTLKNKRNMEFEVDKMPQAVQAVVTEPVRINTFIPANFHGSQQVDSIDYFFVRPKPMEVDTIRSAYWNATKGVLEMPAEASPVFEGGASVDFSYAERPSDVLSVNSYYDFVAMTKWNEAGEPVVCPLEILKEKVSEHTFSEILDTPSFKSGYSYVVNDSSLRVMYVAADGRTIYLKDAGGYAHPDSPTPEQTIYQTDTCDQSNWVALHLPSPLADAQKTSCSGKRLKNFRGKLENKTNPSFSLFEQPLFAEGDTAVVMNSFIPANLYGSQQVDSIDYFFVRPKPMEIDTIRNVMWNGVDKKFEMPIYPEKYGMLPFVGAAKADLSLYETDSVKLTDNYVYDILALTTLAADSSRCIFPFQAWNERECQFALRDLLTNSHFKEGMDCQLQDSSLVVMRVSADAKELYVKDCGLSVQTDAPTEQQVDVLGGHYDQSNWMVLKMPSPLDSAQVSTYAGRRISGVRGVLRSKVNPTLDCYEAPVAGVPDTTQRINNYIPANYHGSQEVDSVDYFFARPKPMEIDTVRCAMWSQSKGRFMMPYFSDEYGYKAFDGAFKPDYSRLGSARPVLHDGDVCDMVVLNDGSAQVGYPLEILSVKPTEFTLAKLLRCNAIPLGYGYPIADSTLTVMGFSDDLSTIYAKDDNLYATPEMSDSTQVDVLGGDYDQSNWVAIYLPEPLDSDVAQKLSGRYITHLRAMLLSKDNPEMDAFEMPEFGDVNKYAKMNTLLPANYNGSQTLGDVNYFLMRPKPMEIDTVRCAMWNEAEGVFEMPFAAADFGYPQFEGAMNPVFVCMDGDKDQFKNGYVYDLIVQTRINDNASFAYINKVLNEQKPTYAVSALFANDRVQESSEFTLKAAHLTVMHISADSLTIYAKDAAASVDASEPAEGQIDYLSGKYAQHNWVAITLPSPLDSAQMANYPGHRLGQFDVVLKSKVSHEVGALAVPDIGEADTTAFFNSYLPANFYGSQTVDTVSYYFSKPAAMEIDTVRCAMWNAYHHKFAMPYDASQQWGMPQFEGEFSADLSALEADSVPLRDNFVYDLLTLNHTAADGSCKVYVLKVLQEVGGSKPLLGDVNGDGVVDVTDVSLLISYVIDNSIPNFRADRADINGDGEVDVTDASLLISMALEGI